MKKGWSYSTTIFPILGLSFLSLISPPQLSGSPRHKLLSTNLFSPVDNLPLLFSLPPRLKVAVVLVNTPVLPPHLFLANKRAPSCPPADHRGRFPPSLPYLFFVSSSHHHLFPNLQPTASFCSSGLSLSLLFNPCLSDKGSWRFIFFFFLFLPFDLVLAPFIVE